MRRLAVVTALAGLACVASTSLFGQDRAAPGTDPAADARRKNVRDIADSLKRPNAGDDDPIARGWKPARTPWGDPEIDGVYTNVDEWGIPFERPAKFDGRSLDSITPRELIGESVERRDGFLERLATGVPAEPGTIGW